MIKSKIANNSIFEYSPGRLRCNNKKISLPTTGSDYAYWNIDELEKFFDNLNDKL